MFICISICIIANIAKSCDTTKNKKVKLSKVIIIILISYAIFFGVVTLGQQNSKLLIQYELSDLYDTAKVSLYLGVIVALSRIARLLNSIIFGKVYPKLKSKSMVILSTMLLGAFIFIVLGYICPNTFLKFLLMTIGFCLILSVRDPYRLYIQDIVLKLTNPEEHQVVISYTQFARKLGTTICSLFISAILLKWPLIYVIIAVSILATIEIIITLKLYKMISYQEVSEK